MRPSLKHCLRIFSMVVIFARVYDSTCIIFWFEDFAWLGNLLSCLYTQSLFGLLQFENFSKQKRLHACIFVHLHLVPRSLSLFTKLLSLFLIFLFDLHLLYSQAVDINRCLDTVWCLWLQMLWMQCWFVLLARIFRLHIISVWNH